MDERLTNTPSPESNTSLTSYTPILKLDTGGHMALIRKIIPMKDGRHFISVSDDKTIRVWDATTGRETAKILGQISDGDEGKIYAIALSPDERWLVVGGYLNNKDDMKYGNIRIYNLKACSLTMVLRSHKDVVTDLAISPDGSYLISGSTDRTINIWNAKKRFDLVRTLKGHTDYVHAIGIFKHGCGYRIVSAGDDFMAILWNLRDGKKIESDKLLNKLQFLAVSSDYIAAAPAQGNNKIIVFDHDLNKIREITSETNPLSLAFSPNGGLLLAGTGADPLVCSVYDVRDNFREITSFKRHDNAVGAVAFLDDSTAVTGGGNNNDIYLWDAHSGDVKGHIAGHGKRVWSVGINGSAIGFENEWTGGDTHTTGTQISKSFNLNTYTIGKASGGFNRIDTSYHGYSLGHERGGDDGREDAVLLVKYNKQVIKRIVRNSTNGIVHRTYGFTNSGIIISGGANGYMTAYNISGEILASFVGHTGEVKSIATDGDLLVSGSTDQTIKLWDLRELNNLPQPKIDYKRLNHYCNQAKKETGRKWTIKQIKEDIDKKGESYIYMQYPSIKPFANIFLSNDRDYVIWTEEGFFNASKDMDKYRLACKQGG